MIRAHPDARNVGIVIQNGEPVAGWMDCTKLGSAVYNLLLNACQAARLGPAPRRVQVTVSEDQRLVHIRVIDSGCGVPAPIRQTLFQPFVSTEKISGIGLGLAIVDCIVKGHGGYVEFLKVRSANPISYAEAWFFRREVLIDGHISHSPLSFLLLAHLQSLSRSVR